MTTFFPGPWIWWRVFRFRPNSFRFETWPRPFKRSLRSDFTSRPQASFRPKEKSSKLETSGIKPNLKKDWVILSKNVICSFFGLNVNSVDMCWYCVRSFFIVQKPNNFYFWTIAVQNYKCRKNFTNKECQFVDYLILSFSWNDGFFILRFSPFPIFFKEVAISNYRSSLKAKTNLNNCHYLPEWNFKSSISIWLIILKMWLQIWGCVCVPEHFFYAIKCFQLWTHLIFSFRVQYI